MPENETCKTCAFWVPDSVQAPETSLQIGTCRRCPPMPVIATKVTEPEYLFSKCREDVWCGEYERKK